MMAEVTAGWRSDPGRRVVGERRADLVRHAHQLLDDVEPALAARAGQIEVVAHEHAELGLVRGARILRRSAGRAR